MFSEVQGRSRPVRTLEVAMYFRQYELGCLSLFSYLVGDETTGRAVVVDPQRDVSQYLADAEAHGLTIGRVIETHFHADFLSGHLELAEATGAAISYGEDARADFPIETLRDGERLSLGDVNLEILATPGHTPESISVVVRETADAEPWGVLTGDALFIGDVGRPDLLASIGWTADLLARRLYRSLHDKLLPLPDETRVYPAHGAGSACGKSMSTESVSTIGEQRRTNYALQPMTEDEFVETVLQGQSVAPLYFSYAADSNRRERPLLDDHEPVRRLDLDDVLAAQQEGAVVLDTRTPEAFATGHVRGSLHVSLDGRFAEYAGDVVRPDQQVVLVADAGRETEAKVRLARIGFDAVVGAFVDPEASLAERPEHAARAARVSATDLAEWRASDPSVQVVDVRNPTEQEDGMVPGARSVPLATLLDRVGELDPERPTVVYCAGGYRSSIGASVLRAHGFTSVADILGGITAWRSVGLPVDTPHEPREPRPVPTPAS
jgi:glyoxylase-like metal-dependent hydrolase (beta-lactamase superfamily II)/rhodanese-related sulfurtransferase